MEFIAKKVAAPFVLASFLMVMFFGFFAMASGPDGRMQNECPFAATGTPLCPQDTFAVAIHHIGAYQSFFSVPLASGQEALLLTLSIVGLALVFFGIPLLRIPALQKGLLYESPPVSYNRKLTRWLSLFENSPSIA